MRRLVCLLALTMLAAAAPLPTPWNSSYYSALRWRLIGPYRAGRVSAVSGTAGNPRVYFIGTPGGGVWKTTDGGVVWHSVLDREGAASIGALAIAPSQPATVYVGTGEQMPGDGVWITHDSGQTWQHDGLAQTRTIDALSVDPHNADTVLVAAATGDTGVYRTIDGGRTWTRTLPLPPNTGAVALSWAPDDPAAVYAATQRGRTGAIYASRDEGQHWQRLNAAGLPLESAGKIGLAVAPGSNGKHVLAYLATGLYGSNDGGASWQRLNHDPRITGGGYFCQVYIDPNHPNVVYAVETSFYRSTDGGRTFQAFKGAPGGDDYHVLWIDPTNSNRMILGVDQGATITVDDGKTWSLWFNQPIAQLYRVAVDQRYPFHMYTSQQDSGGTLALPDRSDYGSISAKDWFSTGGNEDAYSAPDPLNANLVYVNGWYGNVVRFDRRDGQILTVFAAGDRYRLAHPAPLVFSPVDPHRLFLGTQYLLATEDGGARWQQLSGDLTVGGPAPARRGRFFRGAAITAIAPSPLDANIVWVGTSNGLVQVTRDGGKSWSKVLTASGPVQQISASPLAAGAALVVAERVGSQLWRSSDFGAHWQVAGTGLPAGIRAAEQDSRQAGLWFAGGDAGVFVHLDASHGWQPLQLNLPASSVRGLAIVHNDLVAATYGRGMWVLDDITPLRHAAAAAAAQTQQAYLYPPAKVIRFHNDSDQDMPLQPEVPAAYNPPGPAIFDYSLPPGAKGPITLGIYDSRGNLVRQFSSAPQPPPQELFAVPNYWFAPPLRLSAHTGLNRFAWDLRTAYPDVINRSGYVSFLVGDDAIPGRSPRQEPEGYPIAPGRYEARLHVNGQTLRRPFTVAMDPRVAASAASVVRQVALEKQVAEDLAISAQGYRAAGTVPAAQRQFLNANRTLANYYSAIASGDGDPNEEVRSLYPALCQPLAATVKTWDAVHPSPPLAAPDCSAGNGQ